MNRVCIIGNLCKDTETSSSTSGTTYLHNSIAVRRDKDTTDFFEISAFGKMAEFIEKYFHKGSKIAIDGHLQQSSYTDKNGNKRQSVSIIVDKADFCEGKNENKETKTDDFLDVGSDEGLPF